MDPPEAAPGPIPEIKQSFTFPAPQVKIDAIEQSLPPPLVHHLTDPIPTSRYASPLRHHKRTPSAHRQVKETLDAQTQFSNEDADGRTHHRINQFTILEEIGRGSYGAVHLATDQFGSEYAVKEFSKSRLRKRAQSNILRLGPRGPRRLGPGTPLNAGLRKSESQDALFLIREEVAVMKKLNHPNLVQLIEVLDDPEEDSLYMVMEMCRKGVIMKVGLDEHAEPFEEEKCRFWFRDLILAIEYLHAQGVIHRDIKPDNLLLADDDVLKVVDFGVSEIFEKPQNMRISKSAGSPAFLPPELCGKHGDVSGTAADIWSMGVSLFCLKYGCIPFNRDGMLDMYDAIKSDEPQTPQDENPDFVDLIHKLLDKNPESRITMDQIRIHPWVTCKGTDSLLSAEENCCHMIDPPNELEVSRALTRKFNHLLCVMKAIRKFRATLDKKRSAAAARSLSASPATPTPQSVINSKHVAKAEVIAALLSQRKNIRALNLEGSFSSGSLSNDRDVSEQETRFLGIGTGARDDFAMDEATPDVVSDSPTAVDFNVYDRAYESAVEQIHSAQNTSSQKPTVYLTKFVNDIGNLSGGDQPVADLDAPALAVSSQKRQTLSSTETLVQRTSKLDVSGT
ncbi:kinase-like domain-containing protein [Dactylonectria estremocensis]|uniref:Kinase-like domain-containing protein n=1 Tax=Dactylonectria estremocensis TaxID=1079267 RepID=A0A9P9FH36_9HYPO|nr:kinase-like domain-containing protein [Dactylonectria estremocensis]